MYVEDADDDASRVDDSYGSTISVVSVMRI